MLGRLALLLAAAGVRPAAAYELPGLPDAFAELYPSNPDSDLPGLPGMDEISEVAKVWAEPIPSDATAKAEVCTKIYEGLTKAADTPHDVFNGLRIFATTMKKASDSSDAAAMSKALGLKDKFLKAVEKLVKKVKDVQVMQRAMAIEADAQRAKAEAEAAAGSDDAGFDDDDDDLDDDKDEF